MAEYGILTLEHPMIRAQSQPATIGVDTERVLKQMKDVLFRISNAKAISAVQLGFPIRMFVAKWDPFLKEVINPELLESEGSIVMEEGCLSVPDVYMSLARPLAIRVRYQTQDGQTKEQTLTGMSARIFLHEFDHCNGRLIVDYPEAVTP